MSTPSTSLTPETVASPNCPLTPQEHDRFSAWQVEAMSTMGARVPLPSGRG